MMTLIPYSQSTKSLLFYWWGNIRQERRVRNTESVQKAMTVVETSQGPTLLTAPKLALLSLYLYDSNGTGWRNIYRLPSSWSFCGLSARMVIVWTDSPLCEQIPQDGIWEWNQRTVMADVWKPRLELASDRKELDADLVGDERCPWSSQRGVASLAGFQSNRFRFLLH